jgi:hypothetical protein
MEYYYSAIKKNKIMLFAEKWIELEIMMLSQAQKAKYHIFCSYVEYRPKMINNNDKGTWV